MLQFLMAQCNGRECVRLLLKRRKTQADLLCPLSDAIIYIEQ